MAQAPERDHGLTAFQAVLWLAAGLAIPGVEPGWNRDITLEMLLVTWAVALVASSFAYLTSRGVSVTLLPAFAAFLSTAGFTGAIEAAFTASIFVGHLGYSIRIGRTRSSALRHSARMAMVSWVGLRAARAAATAVLPYPEGLPAIAFVLVLSHLVFVFAVAILRGLGAGDRLFPGLSAIPGTTQRLLLPMAFLPLFIPAVEDVLSDIGKEGDPLLMILGASALISAQIAITVSLEKSKWAKGRSLSIQRSLASLSERLSRSTSTVHALQALALEAQGAFSPRSVRIGYPGFAVIRPSGTAPPPDPPLTRRGRTGLTVEVWADEITVLDKSRLDSFISLTEAALQNLELGKRVSLEAWSCMEAMVYSLDRADHRLSGHSRRVARLAVEIGRRLGLQSGLLDAVRMSALLHHVAPAVLGAPADEGFDDQELSAFSLPEEAMTGLVGMNEHYDGSGQPSGLSASSIPISARILAVADEYVSELERGTPQTAMSVVSLRAGSLFDPAVVSTLASSLELGFEV